MNPAKYRNQLQWQEQINDQDESGHVVKKWINSKLGTSWSQIRNIRGNEFIMAGANQVKVSARINLRYRKEIEEKYYKSGEKLRLKFRERIFEIVYINNLEECNEELEIMANEVR